MKCIFQSTILPFLLIQISFIEIVLRKERKIQFNDELCERWQFCCKTLCWKYIFHTWYAPSLIALAVLQRKLDSWLIYVFEDSFFFVCLLLNEQCVSLAEKLLTILSRMTQRMNHWQGRFSILNKLFVRNIHCLNIRENWNHNDVYDCNFSIKPTISMFPCLQRNNFTI